MIELLTAKERRDLGILQKSRLFNKARSAPTKPTSPAESDCSPPSPATGSTPPPAMIPSRSPTGPTAPSTPTSTCWKPSGTPRAVKPPSSPPASTGYSVTGRCPSPEIERVTPGHVARGLSACCVGAERGSGLRCGCGARSGWRSGVVAVLDDPRSAGAEHIGAGARCVAGHRRPRRSCGHRSAHADPGRPAALHRFGIGAVLQPVALRWLGRGHAGRRTPRTTACSSPSCGAAAGVGTRPTRMTCWTGRRGAGAIGHTVRGSAAASGSVNWRRYGCCMSGRWPEGTLIAARCLSTPSAFGTARRLTSPTKPRVTCVRRT